MGGLPADHVAAFVLLDLAIIVAVARAAGRLAVRVGQPRVVGEIVAGVLLGPSLLGPALFQWDGAPGVLACARSLDGAGLDPSVSTCLFPPQARSVLEIVGQAGLVLYMLLVGSAFDLRRLRGRARAVVVVAVGVVAAPVAVGALIAPSLRNETFVAAFGTDAAPSPTTFALFVGALLAVTAFPVAARILQEKGLDRGDMGVVAVAAAALATILMFLVLGAAKGVAVDAPGSAHAARIAGAVAVLAVFALVVRPLLARLPVWTPGSGGSPVAVAVAVALAAGYLTDRVGISALVGGFLAGLVLPDRDRLPRLLDDRLGELTTAVLLPVFLAVSGLSTDLTRLGWSALPGVALLLVAGVAAKWLGGMAFARAGGLSWTEGSVLGVLMNCRGLLVLVVGLAGLSAGVITPAMQVAAVVMAVVTTAMTGPLLDRLLPGAAAPRPAGRQAGRR